MRVPRRLAAVAASVAAVVGLGLAAAPAAQAHSYSDHHLGTKSLAAVLLSDGDVFDHNWNDYDITTVAVLAVLAAKPKSPVGVLANGKVPVTAFIPTDRAFQRLVRSLTGKTLHSEKAVFKAVAGLGIDTVESVLLYHVVPGATIDSGAALKADGASLTTALGPTITVRVRSVKNKVVALKDQDYNAPNPLIVQFDINKGNRQIAHGIDRVLRPSDL